MEFYNVMELYVFQNELFMLGYKPKSNHGSGFLLLYAVALNSEISEYLADQASEILLQLIQRSYSAAEHCG